MAAFPRVFTGVSGFIRGLAHRGGTTALILLVSVAATAAAAAGPIYYQAARISILRDMVVGRPLIARGFEANLTGSVDGIEAQLRFGVGDELGSEFGTARARRLFTPPIMSLEGTATYAPQNANFVLAWRDGECGHLRFQGRCPSAADQVLVSQFMAKLNGWRIGQRLRGLGWPALTITGIYQPPPLSDPYWAPRVGTYFPVEAPSGNSKAESGFDAFFTAWATLGHAPAAQQGIAVEDDYLNTSHLAQADVGPLGRGIAAVTSSDALNSQNIVFTSDIPDTMARVQANWRTVAVPVVLVTLEVLMLSWLLLFVAVTDAVDARGPEVALARLRGHGRVRTLLFALSEPAALLAVALPAGTAVGWAAASALDEAVLRRGTPTALSWLAWAAAAAAAAGGFTAVLLAARRTLRRSVVEQFRRSGRRVTDRGWVLDSILLTGSAAGLLELAFTGHVGSASHSVLDLLVPGLLGMAVAVVASRLLPAACHAAYGLTGRRGGLAAFLAIRHIARRPGGTRTTIVLATAFALTSFAVAAWAVEQGNYRLVAGVRTGAPTVLTVTTPPGRDLGAIVDRADPGGRLAAVVDQYVSLSGSSAGRVTLGVDPQRFARVAYWPVGFGTPLAALAKRLDPPTPAPIVLRGDAFRIGIRVESLSAPGEQVSANVTTGATPVNLGALPAHGNVTLTGALVGCPCVLQTIVLDNSVKAVKQGNQSAVTGTLTITSMSERVAGRWTPVRPSALASAADWRAGLRDSPPDQITGGGGGLTWAFRGVPGTRTPMLVSVNRPAALPALLPVSLLGGRSGLVTGTAFDGSALPLEAIGVTAVPGAPGNGAIVDRRFAELASNEDFTYVTRQVWLAAGAAPRIVPKLKAAGVRIDASASAAVAAAALARQGPGLASLLFLADAAAAALLAIGAAILGLYLSARRRRYEYAALEASGLSRGTLRRALLMEVAVVLGFGTVVGVAAGLAAARMVLRAVPEFVSYPSAPPLVYAPAPAPLAVLLGAAAVILALAAAVASLALIASVRPEQLREAPA